MDPDKIPFIQMLRVIAFTRDLGMSFSNLEKKIKKAKDEQEHQLEYKEEAEIDINEQQNPVQKG